MKAKMIRMIVVCCVPSIKLTGEGKLELNSCEGKMCHADSSTHHKKATLEKANQTVSFHW